MSAPVATYTAVMFPSDQLFIRRCHENLCRNRGLSVKFRYMTGRASDGYCTRIKFWLHPEDVDLLKWLNFRTFVETESEILCRPFRTEMPAACRSSQ